MRVGPSGGGDTPVAGLTRIAFLSDFDGTISPQDVGNRVFTRFGGEAGRRAVERWRNGEISTRECLALECSDVTASQAEILAAVGDTPIDPSFMHLVALANRASFPLLVVSEGFDFYIRHILDRHGFPHVPVSANRAVFSAGRLMPEFADQGNGCGACGNCKGWHVRRFREEGRKVVFMGDGLSDRCAAREADLIFAREGHDLVAWCLAARRPHLTFDTIDAVITSLESHAWDTLVERAREGAPA